MAAKHRSCSQGCLGAVLLVLLFLGFLTYTSDPSPRVPMTAAEREVERQRELAKEAAERESLAAEREAWQAEREAKAKADAAAAEKLDADVRTYRTIIETVGAGDYISRVGTSGNDTLVITVRDNWHVMPYQSRVLAAQDIRKGWDRLRTGDGESNWITIVDRNGNKVGGVTFLGETWVQE